MSQADHDEILRVRERLHQLADIATKAAWRIEALDEWRKEIERRLVRVEDGLEKLATAEMIADAVAEKLKERTGLQLTVVQKVGASLVGAFAIVSSLHAWGVF